MNKLGIKIVIDPTFSADDWELFMLPGSDEVASELNASLKEAVNSGMSKRDAYDAVYVVMKKHSSFGAADSEPLWLLERSLNKIYG